MLFNFIKDRTYPRAIYIFLANLRARFSSIGMYIITRLIFVQITSMSIGCFRLIIVGFAQDGGSATAHGQGEALVSPVDER